MFYTDRSVRRRSVDEENKSTGAAEDDFRSDGDKFCSSRTAPCRSFFRSAQLVKAIIDVD